MQKIKKAPVPKFEEYIKKSISNIELIKTKQEEKQAILDEYEKQHKRFAEGRISKRAFDISVKENKKLLGKIDSQIKRSISASKTALRSALKIASSQTPQKFSLSLEGLTSPAKKAIKRLTSSVRTKKRSGASKTKKLRPKIKRKRK